MPTVQQTAERRRETEKHGGPIAYPAYAGACKTGLPAAFGRIVCRDAGFVEMLKKAAKVSATRAAVLVCGESGVGKERIVEAIHLHGKERQAPFVKVNCAAIPETLFESELFGYEKGAFTGARQNGKKGKFELANGGTLFLDEIGELPLGMQVKLLRVLQEKEVEPLGGTRPVPVDFRLVTATNRDLEQMVREGTFREDLFYRLNIVQLKVPPLRQRREDIPELVRCFLSGLAQEYGKSVGIDTKALVLLVQYDWPGNVRELKNVMEQAFIFCEDGSITPDDLPERFTAGAPQNREQPQDVCYNLNEIVARVEYETISAVLQMTGNNKTKASEILGISRRGFYQKLEKYNLA